MEIETITTPPADAGGSVNEKPKAEAKPDDSGVSKTETPAERKLRLKFGKQEREVSEAEAVALAQKGWASDEKFKSAKAAERHAQEIVDSADVEAMLKRKYGKDKLEWAKEVLIEELKRKSMSPEDREVAEREDRLKQLRQEEEELLEKRANERLEQQTQKYQEQYDREFSDAMKKHGLPKNKYAMDRAVKIATEIVDMDLEPDWDLVVGEAKRQIQEEVSELIDQVEDGVGFLGEERARKISRALVAKGMPKSEAAKIVKQAEGNKLAEGEKTPVDSDEYFEKKRQAWLNK